MPPEWKRAHAGGGNRSNDGKLFWGRLDASLMHINVQQRGRADDKRRKTGGKRE
jgi:hypothetical protein